MCSKSAVLIFVISIGSLLTSRSATADKFMYKTITSFRDCLGKKHANVCMKEKALDLLNRTITSDEPMIFYDMVNIERNPDYRFNTTPEINELPVDFSSRNLILSDIIYDKIEEFFKSRVIKFNMAPAFDEARGKKDKGKGGMMMLAAGGMACMMAQLFMGKIAFLAGTALILSKVALFMSAIIGLKKLSSGGGGGGESHVVYATPVQSGGDYGHSHGGGGGGGGGGWHRSLDGDTQTMIYRAHTASEEHPQGY